MTTDQLREFEEMLDDALARHETLAEFRQSISGLIVGRELRDLRPELKMDEVVEDIRKFLWERK